MEKRAEVDRICEQVRRAYSGNAWHGNNLSSILDHVDPALVFETPYPNGNCIWTLVAHLATWYDVAVRRLNGEIYDPPRELDFPIPTRFDLQQWEGLREKLQKQHDRFLSRIEQMNDSDLEVIVSEVGYSAYILLHGIVQHLLYHAGQIAVIAKILEEPGAKS